MKLDIGAGNSPKQGFKSVDKYTSADYNADMTSLPFPDESIEEIYTSHALEHLPKREVLVALCEMYRVLEFDGLLTIIVPDLEWCMKAYLVSHDKVGFSLDAIYGNQEHEGEFHKTGFCLDELRSLIFSNGFELIEDKYIQDHGVQSIYIKAKKWKE